MTAESVAKDGGRSCEIRGKAVKKSKSQVSFKT